MSTQVTAYTCPYCRVPSDGGAGTCPHCGAPVDVRMRVSDSGWVEQPPIRDMARIRFGRSTCQISGQYAPVAEMGLHADDSVYFSHHVLLHTDPSVRLDAMKMGKSWDRALTGMPLIMMTARGPGHIAFSADGPGETLAIPLMPHRGVDVVEHKFLVATENVGFKWEFSNVWYETQSGNETERHHPIGRTMDRFFTSAGPGLLLLHAPGNVFVRDLRPGEAILIQPGGLIWKDPSVHLNLHFEYPGGPFWYRSARAEAKTVWLNAHGPGRVAVQSVFERPEMVGPVVNSRGASFQRW